MSFKQTIVLFGVLIILAGSIFYIHYTTPEKKDEKGPEIWSVDEENIEHIRIRVPRKNKEVAFFKGKDEKWFFDDQTKHPVYQKRWGGIVLLVSGPKSKRMIAEKVENLEEYGFADPQMIIDLGVKGRNGPLQILFGDPTPKKDQFYVKLKHSSPVYIIADIYCQVLMRLAVEPPIPPLIKARTLKATQDKAKTQ